MKFPIAKQIASKTIADEIIPVTPTLEGPPIKETYTDHMGNTVRVFENGGKSISSYASTHLFGDYGHSFGRGFFVVDENGEMLFRGDERYMEVVEKCRPYWRILKGLQEKFKEYRVEPSRGDRLAVNDKIIKGISFYPGMRMESVEKEIELISQFIQEDINKGRIVKGKYGV